MKEQGLDQDFRAILFRSSASGFVFWPAHIVDVEFTLNMTHSENRASKRLKNPCFIDPMPSSKHTYTCILLLLEIILTNIACVAV